MAVTTIGRIKLSKIMPEGFKDIERPLNSKELTKVMTDMANKVPASVYKETLQKLNDFGDNTAFEYGGVASIHLNDLKLPGELRALRNELERKVYRISQRRDISSADKKALIIKTVKEATPIVDKAVMDVLGAQNNSFGLLVGTGVRGKPQQLRQLVIGDLLTVDSKMRDIPYPSFRSYGEGVTPLQYWTASHGGRYGYIQVQKATADAGYFSKQTRSVAHRQVITMDDCKNPTPYIMDADDDNTIGSLLFYPVKGKSGKVYAANTVLTDAILSDLKGKVAVRSALCCSAPEGLCSKCAGVRESGRLSDIGDAVGLNGISAVNEGVTQSGLSSKHSGGESVSAAKVKHGFAAIEQFINMPENFVGGAAITPVDGRVSKISDAPQGGKNITIAESIVHVPHGFEAKVKVGDTVEAGDVLSDGMLNIGAITEHKGIGAGRKAFVDEFFKLLDSQGGAIPKKQLEPFARAYFDRVEITDPDGLQGHIIGDITTYNKIAANWKPRENTKVLPIRNAKGKYLEQPAAHHTIGTKVTQSTIKDLEDAGIKTIAVNDKEPPFRPYITSAKQFSSKDEDWITALSGEGLMRSFQEHIQRGSLSDPNGVSYYPKLALMGSPDDKPLTI